MIVEDEAVILNTLKATFRHLDDDEETELFPFCDPLKAAMNFEKIKPDLIILDYMMPHLTGMEFLDAIKWDKETSPTKVIIYTAYNGSTETTCSMADRVHRVVKKPYSPSEFVRVVKEVLQE